MKLFEVYGSEMELAALVQYLISRSEDLGTKGKVGTETFLNMADNLGINISLSQLQSMAQRAPLKNMIADVSPQHVSFDLTSAGKATMSVDKARKTVDSMAKRAMKR
jgi:hypothetical protein